MKRFLTGAAVVVMIATPVFIYYIITSPCLTLRNGDTGLVFAAYPLAEGDEFSVTFVHSVNQSPVTDVYRIWKGQIYVVRTIYYAFGAGVQTEIEEGQILEYGADGSMIVSGLERPMNNLSYIVGTVSDHLLKVGEESVSLRQLCGRNTTVRFLWERKILKNPFQRFSPNDSFLRKKFNNPF